MFFYRGWIGPAAVFGGGGGGEMPFYIGGAVNKGHIIEINDLENKIKFWPSCFGN